MYIFTDQEKQFTYVIDQLLQDSFPSELYMEDLRVVFNRMRPLRRQVLESKINGLSQKEIARLLKISQPAVSMHLSRAKKTFLNYLGL